MWFVKLLQSRVDHHACVLAEEEQLAGLELNYLVLCEFRIIILIGYTINHKKGG